MVEEEEEAKRNSDGEAKGNGTMSENESENRHEEDHKEGGKESERKINLDTHARYTQSADGTRRKLNHFELLRTIGAGAFGTVELARNIRDGREVALKTFSKTRLRHRMKSEMLRGARLRRGRGKDTFQGPGRDAGTKTNETMITTSEGEEMGSVDLIRTEIAVMKKLNHPNVVSLLEVLDDPNEDNLYMVLELCRGGPIMDVNVQKESEKMIEQDARHIFRQVVLGVEYLHENGIVHRDIKPDNLLLTSKPRPMQAKESETNKRYQNCTIKLVDFGVSEMFVKGQDRWVRQSTGSPAFMAPELVTPHTPPPQPSSPSSSEKEEGPKEEVHISGRACDIWSMGVTLYTLVTGKLPFAKAGVMELYESIRNDSPEIPARLSESCQDILKKLFEKDPEKRIKLPQLREHPWITNNGQDPLISTAENTVDLVLSVTTEEVEHAISHLSSVATVVQAISRLKRLSTGSTSVGGARPGADNHSHRPLQEISEEKPKEGASTSSHDGQDSSEQKQQDTTSSSQGEVVETPTKVQSPISESPPVCDSPRSVASPEAED